MATSRETAPTWPMHAWSRCATAAGCPAARCRILQETNADSWWLDRYRVPGIPGERAVVECAGAGHSEKRRRLAESQCPRAASGGWETRFLGRVASGSKPEVSARWLPRQPDERAVPRSRMGTEGRSPLSTVGGRARQAALGADGQGRSDLELLPRRHRPAAHVSNVQQDRPDAAPAPHPQRTRSDISPDLHGWTQASERSAAHVDRLFGGPLGRRHARRRLERLPRRGHLARSKRESADRRRDDHGANPPRELRTAGDTAHRERPEGLYEAIHRHAQRIPRARR